MPASYLSLLKHIYAGQSGIVGHASTFPICRGVRQGDVLSPLLFNAALEHVMRKWKLRIFGFGWMLSEIPGAERLTNERYADDLLLFAKSLDEGRHDRASAV